MSAGCCGGGAAACRPARRLAMAATSVLPGALLIVLPKCPLCLAAWLTVATGIGFSAAGAAWVREILVVFSIAAVALAAMLTVRRRMHQSRL